MLGFYNYTMYLTYLSLISGTAGIIFSLIGNGHPLIGIFCLLFSGLCDAFDGKVARTKKDRTEMECKFGIQIDSLSDLVAFGVLPACIGIAFFRLSEVFETIHIHHNATFIVLRVIVFVLCLLYTLAALIRLAYFNVTEEERQKSETTARKKFLGLPVTSSALIFPTFALINFIVKSDLSFIYFILLAITGTSFLLKFEIKKPSFKELLIMTAIGLVEFIVFILFIILYVKK